MTQAKAPINYLYCNKEGLHEDERLNIVCLETGCLENLACCCVCIDSDHKGHISKPLKFVIDEARKHSAFFKYEKMNIDILLDLVATQRKTAFDLLEKHRIDIISTLNSIQQALQSHYNRISQQILVKSTDSNILIEEVIQRASTSKTIEQLKFVLKKLVAFAPSISSPSPVENITEAELIVSLEESSSEVNNVISENMKQAQCKLTEFQKYLYGLISSTKIWKPLRFKFTEELKHTDIKLLDQNTVKAIKNSAYKFAIMEPGIGGKSPSFSFKIKQSYNNWLAIGLCHKKIIQSKSYGFVFGSVGHGAYMISSNGGSWSHLRADQNNTIKGFKFSRGDIVTIHLSQQLKKITFQMETNKYELPFEAIQDDQLCPCVLFYYVNDEVEYLPNGKA